MAFNLKKLRAFTLAELLIIITILGLVYFIILGANYFNQAPKARDLKRKENLSKIQKIIEDFHVDHNRYPSMDEMVYALMPDVTQNWSRALAGKLCGSIKTSTILNQYAGELPCEPSSPNQEYVYFRFSNGQKYAIFTNLENKADPEIEKVGCKYGCSYFVDEADPTGSISYNYFNYYVSSGDFSLLECYGSTTFHACYPGRANVNDRCKICTDYSCETGYTELYCSPQWCVDNCEY